MDLFLLQNVNFLFCILLVYFQAEKAKENHQSKEGHIKILKTKLEEKEKELNNQQQSRLAQLEQVRFDLDVTWNLTSKKSVKNFNETVYILKQIYLF